jgi:hypothetical protein
MNNDVPHLEALHPRSALWTAIEDANAGRSIPPESHLDWLRPLGKE